MSNDNRRSQYKLVNMASFQHFDPSGAYDLALYMGKQAAELGDQEAADKWAMCAAAISAGKHPPDEMYCLRVAGSMRAHAAALMAQADKIERDQESHQLAKKNAAAAAERKRLEREGQKGLPKAS